MAQESPRKLLAETLIDELYEEYDELKRMRREIADHGQSHSAAGRSYTLADLGKINERIQSIRVEIIKLECGESVLKPRLERVTFGGRVG